MINKDMKLIPKAQYGAQFIAQSDNTRVAKPIIQERIPYKLKPNEFYFVDKKIGKKTLIKQKQETVTEDKRSTYQKKQDKTRTEQIQKKYEADKNYNEGLKTIGALTTLAMPSTYIGPVFNNNGKSYLDNIISGEGTGDAAGNLAIDLATPLAISKVSKIAQTVPKTVGQKYVAPYISSKMLNRSINANPKGQIIVSENYFNSPYNWYRITESPEVYGIKEMGKNVTTIDASDMYIPSNQFRLDVIDNNLTFRDGYWYKPLKRVFNFSKRGSAHGNTSQAAKGHLWQGTTADSRKFPTIVLEGDMPIQTYRGFNPATGLDSRTSFHLVDSETIPMGARIGFHTGEMPIDNLGYFQRLKNGKYSYQGTIIPDKRINVENY